MARRANYYKLGIFVLSALGIGIAALVIWGAGYFFRDTIMMETYLDESVQGLEVGAPVKYRGVRVGSVREITFVNEVYAEQLDEDELFKFGRLVLVRMEIEPDKLGTWSNDIRNDRAAARLERLFDIGLRVRLAPQGITGLEFMEADYVKPEENPVREIVWEPEVYRFPSAQSTTGRFTESAEVLVEDLKEAGIDRIGQNINELLEELIGGLEEADFKGLGSDIGQLTAELRDSNERVRELLASEEIETMLTSGAETAETAQRIAANTEEDIEAILSETRQLVEDMQVVTEKMREVVDSGQISRTLDNVTTASANIATASEDLPETMDELRQTVRRIDNLVTNQQYNIELIVENLTQASENMREASVEARENPGALFREAPPPFDPRN